jgi:signal transduction histidine kinase
MQIPGVTHSCWALTKSGSGLLAATAEGVFRIFPDGSARQLTNNNSLAVLDVGTHFYSGEFDAVYLVSADGKVKKKVCQIENVKKIIKDNKGIIWLQSTNGIVGSITPDKDTVELYKTKDQIASMRSIVDINGRVVVMEAESTKPFPYPFYSYTDDSGVCWLTNNEGKALYGWKNGQLLNDVNRLLAPFNDITIRSMYRQGDKLWIGSDNGLTIVNTKVQDPYLNQKPELRIRSIILGGDSILWGGFGKMPESLPTLKHDEHNLKFTFSLCSTPVTGNNLYRYRLNDGNWSTWSTNTEASFVNLSHGTYTFYVQARDAMNRPSEIAYIQFEISPPFYLRWYMYLLYFLLLVTILYFLFKLRLRRLEKDKKQLELIIKDRTAEVVRLEKMATAGKLTQGLIDRILNPLNYINNFSKLSEGLIKDVKANIEDDKDNMDQENYEDTMDVLDMLTGNLQKVSEHGQNTTRTLKAMEEILKDRSGGKVPIDMAAVIRQDELFLKEYYKQEIAQYGIQIIFDYPSEGLQIVGNAELLSKTMMSLLGNAVYATVKKAQRTPYAPEIALRATTEGGHVKVSVRDNGIGIESTIIDKIFDPFFTTKTTGEASGVGLYLSHEIIQDHGGNLSVESVKDEYSEFTFIIPVKKA